MGEKWLEEDEEVRQVGKWLKHQKKEKVFNKTVQKENV